MKERDKVKENRKERKVMKKLLDDVKEKRRYWNLKQETLDRSVWGARSAGFYVPAVKTELPHSRDF